MPDDPVRIFRPAEANALLPAVIPLVRQLQALHHSIGQVAERLEGATKQLAAGNGHPLAAHKDQVQELTIHQLQLAEAFQSALDQLQALGAVLKDAAIGLVDFYARRGTELVCLCWKLGEDHIRFWHDLQSGYGGRQPLEHEDA